MSQNSRFLEPIIRDFKVMEWTCSNCAWRKTAEDAANATENTIAAFNRHECKEYPVLRNKEEETAAHRAQAFHLLRLAGPQPFSG